MYEIAMKLLNVLYDNGYDSYIIGGYVRDRLLLKDSKDIDIATNAMPADLEKIFGEDIVIEKYGSARVKYMEYIFEVTTFREDINYINNRWPQNIKFKKSLDEDLIRRDFTINTIAIDHSGNYIDLLGGITDLNNRLIKCVGNSDIKIKEDAFRILRAVRLSCTLDFKLDSDLVNSIKKYSYLLKNISFDRKKSELDLIFSSDNVLNGVKSINDLEIDKYLEIEGLNSVKFVSNYLGIWAQVKFSEQYNFTKMEAKTISNIRKIIEYGHIDIYILYRYSIEDIFVSAEILGINKDKINNVYENMTIHKRSEININVDEIKSLTKTKISDIYIDLENEILYNNLKNEKKDIINYIINKYKE